VQLNNFMQQNNLMDSEDGSVAQDRASSKELPVVQEVQIGQEDTQEVDYNEEVKVPDEAMQHSLTFTDRLREQENQNQNQNQVLRGSAESRLDELR
jgi:hypothetical protein